VIETLLFDGMWKLKTFFDDWRPALIQFNFSITSSSPGSAAKHKTNFFFVGREATLHYALFLSRTLPSIV